MGNGAPVKSYEIAKKYPEMSLHFLEQVFRVLRGKGFVRSLRGPGGGYVLTRPANMISVKDIVVAFESNIRSQRYLPKEIEEIESISRNKVLRELETYTLLDIQNMEREETATDSAFSRQLKQWAEKSVNEIRT